MSTHAYNEVFNEVIHQVQRLSSEEQEQLLEALSAIIRQRTTDLDEEPWHSLLELEGLGAEIWEGIDPKKYIEEERRSWRG
jgi:hypothetical protein